MTRRVVAICSIAGRLSGGSHQGGGDSEGVQKVHLLQRHCLAFYLWRSCLSPRIARIGYRLRCWCHFLAQVIRLFCDWQTFYCDHVL
jgi:hypothetical protein